MITRIDFIFGIALPLLLGFVFFLFGRRFAGPLALGAGLATAVFGTTGWPDQFPPNDSIAWLGFLAVAWMIVGVADAARRWPQALRWLVAAAVSFATVWLLSGNQRASWSGQEQIVWIGSLSAAMFVLWASMDLLAERVSGRMLGLLLMLLAGLTALVIAMSGSQTLGNRAGTLALAMLPAWALGRPKIPARGTAIVFVPLWCGVVLAHHLYSYADVPPTWSLLLVGATPLLWWLGQAPPVRRRTRWQQVAVQLSLALVPLAIAVILVAIPFIKAMEELGG
jgi:hypothetical protein